MIKIANGWTDYEIIASGGGEKLERWGKLILLRPDPQAIWAPSFKLSEYKGINAVYKRSADGGGRWEGAAGANFKISRKNLTFNCKLMGFKHTGLFPEQAVNWDAMGEMIIGNPRILNLFAYTGGATAACAAAGAEVTHVDASKGMCERAKMNCMSSGIPAEKTRFIVDDCMKFVEREIRRGKSYDAVIMDPPSYGRGTNGEMWRVEDDVFALVKKTVQLLSDSPVFYLINSYTTGLSPTVMKNIIDICLPNACKTEAYELGLPTNEKNIVLPAGASAMRNF